MTAHGDLEQQLHAHFAAQADRTVLEGQLDSIGAEAAAVRQRPTWLATIASRGTRPFTGITSPVAAVPRVPLLVAAAVLIALMLAALILAGRPSPPALTGWIVYGASDRPGGPMAVHVMRADGSGDHLVRPEPHDRAFWSADGRRLGFEDGYANADGSGYRTIDTVQGALLVSAWDWSADGGSLLVQGSSVSTPARNGVYLEPVSGDTTLIQLTHFRPEGVADEYGRLVPAGVSPDGASVAFVALRGHDLEGRLMVVGTDGQAERRIGDGTVAIGPTWSPDGSSLLATSAGSLVRIDLVSGAATTIAGSTWPEGQALSGAYAPDGTHILVRVRAPDGTVRLYVADAGGGGIVRLAGAATDVGFADWGPDPVRR